MSFFLNGTILDLGFAFVSCMQCFHSAVRLVSLELIERRKCQFRMKAHADGPKLKLAGVQLVSSSF